MSGYFLVSTVIVRCFVFFGGVITLRHGIADPVTGFSPMVRVFI